MGSGIAFPPEPKIAHMPIFGRRMVRVVVCIIPPHEVSFPLRDHFAGNWSEGPLVNPETETKKIGQKLPFWTLTSEISATVDSF